MPATRSWFRSITSVWMFLAVSSSSALVADDVPAGNPDAEQTRRIRVARRDAMQRLAESFQVTLRTDDADLECQLVKPCVQFFTDSKFHPEIGEGTTWVWQHNGLPQVIAQVYQWERDRPEYNWRVGVYNLSAHRVILDDGQSVQREYRPTFFKRQPIPDAQASSRR